MSPHCYGGNKMIQVLGLRPFFNVKKNKEEKKHELFATSDSVPELFKNLDAIIEKIPEAERWNVYFTVLDCLDPRLCKGQLRRFKSQEIFPFDIDGCDLKQIDKYTAIFFKVTGLDPAKTIVICSGNGLQFFAQFPKPFDNPEYFEQKRIQYRATCERVDRELVKEKLPGNADPSVWSPARIMRLPKTINRKPNKEDKLSYIISYNIAPQEILWDKMAGVPELQEDDQVQGWNDQKAPKLDHKEIYSKCEFLKATVSGADGFREPHYYAALSIVGRMENGLERARKLRDAIRTSSPDSSVASFSDSEVEKKWKQALEASGPRTCKNIDQVWGKCEKCVMYKKCVSPVSIKGEDHIATKDTGFHSINSEGKPKPSYTDLLKYFDSIHHHKTLNQNGLVFAWKETHYELMSKHDILNFAQKHFKPAAMSNMREEFLRLTQCTNLVDADFFAKNLNGKLNFKNGVYNFHKRTLTPHDPSLGFRYCLPYEFDPDAIAPRFNKFMREITDGDADLCSILEEFGGFALSGDEYWIHKTLFLLGEGSNGKSTFIDVLKMCAGKDNYSTVSLKDLRSENNRQLLEGKLFNIAPELAADALKDTEKFKYLSDGSEITVKLMYNQPYKIKNRAKMIFASDNIPETDDPGFAFMRRLVIVPFNKTFDDTNRDDQILEKLERELPGIMNVFIAGYERLLKNRRFTVARSSEEEKEWVSSENNLVKMFISETPNVVVHPLNGRCHFTTTFDIKRKFDEWAIERGIVKEVERVTVNKFSRLLQKAVPSGRMRKGEKKVEGIALNGYYDIELR